jgi:hypothetical protein
MLMRPASACIALWIAALSASPVAAERPPRYSEEDILNGTTIALSSQDLCGFRVDEKAIRALMAAKLPDLSSDLISCNCAATPASGQGSMMNSASATA